jgi:protein O-mannosyl-transferase
MRLLPGLPLLAAVLAYGPSLDGGFVFDDVHVLGPGSAIAAGDWWQATFGLPHTSLANRPIAALSLVALPQFGGSDALTHRTGNLLLHLLNTLLLFAVAHRCFATPNVAARFRPSAAPFAVALASVWACHPLGVDAVAYPTQRSMLLGASAFLFAVYCVLRDAMRPGISIWKVLATAALAFGMCSKEEFVAAPILLILFERAFLASGWRELIARRWFHGALCSVWLLLALCVTCGPRNPTVGFSALAGVGPLEWLFTQSWVVLHYLGNTVWPCSLRGAYDHGVTSAMADAALPLLVLTALFVASTLQWRRRPWLAWLWACFFLLLGPTSSFLPIVTEPVADRRAYLPMLATLAPLTLLATLLLSRLPLSARARRPLTAAALLGLVSCLVVATRHHADQYRDQATFWTTAFHQNELTNRSLPTSMILSSYAQVLQEQGKVDEALVMITRAMQCPARLDDVPLRCAELLWTKGNFADSERVLRDLAKRKPNNIRCIANLATVLLSQHERDRKLGAAQPSDPRLQEALQMASTAYARRKNPDDLGLVGLALLRLGRGEQAASAARQAVGEGASNPAIDRTLCEALLDTRQFAQAAASARHMRGIRPQDVALLTRVMESQASADDSELAAALARMILAVDPGNSAARRILDSRRKPPR